jgi:hypothetical protein
MTTRGREPAPEYRLRLRALPDRVPAAVRLRRLLKVLLRGYGFRALAVEEVPAEAPAHESGDADANDGR